MSKVVVEKQMGYTRSEFLRVLPKALGSDTFTQSVDGKTIEYGSGKGRLVITLSEERVREITPLVRIPYMDVTFEFNDFADDDLTVFRKRLDRSFQKGGG